MNILWFRRDLKIADNESLSRACSNNAKVLPCLVINPWLFKWRGVWEFCGGGGDIVAL